MLQVIAEHGPGLSLAAVDAMVYAEGVIKEALRLAPPAGAMMRKTLVDTEVSSTPMPGLCLCHTLVQCAGPLGMLV
jgi:cytochrome P450